MKIEKTLFDKSDPQAEAKADARAEEDLTCLKPDERAGAVAFPCRARRPVRARQPDRAVFSVTGGLQIGQ